MALVADQLALALAALPYYYGPVVWAPPLDSEPSSCHCGSVVTVTVTVTVTVPTWQNPPLGPLVAYAVAIITHRPRAGLFGARTLALSLVHT